MHEALTLFDSLVNGEYFTKKPIILFLNKIDLFGAKLKFSRLSTHFPDYDSRDDAEEAAKEYFANRFRKINRTRDREIYIHYTNATDTDLLQATMQDVQDVIIKKNLRDLVSKSSEIVPRSLTRPLPSSDCSADVLFAREMDSPVLAQCGYHLSIINR
jgi:guanine nucleotide-binding protein subunit alpha